LRTPWYKVFFNKGRLGEYRLYDSLISLGDKNRVLANLYVPKNNNNEYSEIDLVMIHPSGIFVFESKNYSGWIYGNDKQKEWTQTFKTGRKERFYNPVFQNATHIRALSNYLRDYPDIPYYSFVVFGGDCELKKLTITSNSVHVVKRNKVKSIISKYKAIILGDEQIQQLYNYLYKLAIVDDKLKKDHVKRITQKYNK
jgi:hypothetical protein